MKAVIIQNIEEANKIKDYSDAFILPIEHYSINYLNTFSINDIKKIQKLGKEVFIMFNKNIHNNELEEVKKYLLEIDKLKTDGIFFYDIAIYSLKQKLKINTPLIWSAEHLTTNYKTINCWYENGVEYAYLSSELNKEEIDEIIKNTKATLFINVFGYLPMFTSKRHLIKNYLNYFKIKDSKKQKYIEKEGKTYPVIDDINGTTIYSNYIYNPKINFKAKYHVYNSFLIPDILEVLKQNNYPKELGFLDKNIIYKVRK